MSKLKYAAVHKGWAAMHSILEITGRGSIVALYVDTGYDRHRVEMSPRSLLAIGTQVSCSWRVATALWLTPLQDFRYRVHALTFYALFPIRCVYITCPVRDFGHCFHMMLMGETACLLMHQIFRTDNLCLLVVCFPHVRRLLIIYTYSKEIKFIIVLI